MTAQTKSEKDRVVIFDTTLRDGEQCPGATMTHEEKLEVAELLDAMGVDIIEAGFPIASEGDFAAVNEIIPVTVSATGVLTFPTTLAAADYTASTVRLSGRKDRDFTKGDPLSFTSAFNPRQILWGLKFIF